ncbi:MAG: general secretion pathway protein GspB [Desulfuromonadaceae bacterium]
MSYILEALKKSEKKRQRETTNLTHLATDESPEQERNSPQRPLWPLLVGLALVINAGVMLIIFWPSQSSAPDASAPGSTRQQEQGADSGVATNQATESMAQNTSAPESEPMEKKPPGDEMQTRNATADVPALETNQRRAATTAAPIPSRTERKTQAGADTGEEITQDAATPAVPPDAESETSTSRAAAAAKPAAVRFSDLPLDYRRQLPEMHMSVHAYSETPSAGLVRVNNKMLRPGADLTGGVRLEEITRQGAIFSFAGRRFLLPR